MNDNERIRKNFYDLTGQRFGRLTVIERHGSDRHGLATWRCLCDCGNEHICRGRVLRLGKTISCGCVNQELRKKRTTKHDKRRTRIYGVWTSMKNRCYNPKSNRYHRYGARGITVCDEWRENFQAFYDWAMTNGYDENASKGKCTIDRIDNDKGYSPDNCRWVDMKEQSKNKSKRGNV